MKYQFYDNRGIEILMPPDTESMTTKVVDLLKQKKIKQIILQNENGKQNVSIDDFKENVGL